jgi:hypothetical protein
MNNSIQKTHYIPTENRRYQESIVITKCLTPECTGFYTDSISEYFLIRCMDPKHNIGEVGHQPTPDGNDALQETTATQPAKLGGVIKWNIHQS